MSKLYVLDAVNFLFRSYFAIGPITNTKGQSTNALYGFIRSIFKIIKEHNPEYLVAVFDGPDNTKGRKELYAKYKAHRAGMPEDLFPQLEWAIEFCEMAGIPYLSVPGVEADDVMGSVAKWAEKKGLMTYLCTSDKDLCQLVSPHIHIINPAKDNLHIDRKKVKEIHGVYPEQFIDYLSLMGDASDGIPGLQGIGPKTAASLLQEFGTLDNVLKNPDKIKGKKAETIREGKEDAYLSKKLATIYTDVPFPNEINFFRLKEPNLEKVADFYQEMHFLSLLKELKIEKAPPEELPLDFSEEVSYALVDDEEALEKLVTKLKNKEELCVDTETSGLSVVEAELVGIALSDGPSRGWYIPTNGKLGTKKVVETLKPLLENPKIAFFGHNIKYDLHILHYAGIDLQNIGFDTMIASYLLSPQKQRHGLDTLCLELMGKKKIPITDLIGKGKKQKSMGDVPIEKVSYYACEDVDYTYRLKQLFLPNLKEEKLLELLNVIELPLIPVLQEMEERGIYIDKNKMTEMGSYLNAELKKVTKEIYKIAGETFNLNSPKQMGVVLFEKMEIRPAKKTKTGYSTSAEVLESLTNQSPIIPKILNYRALEKLRSTYVEALPTQIAKETSRIHCTFNQSVAATGRLSCQDPNLQNIPARSAEGKKIRSAFRPEKKGWSFLSSDYSQIELRLLAHLSDDPALLKAFRAGEDIHASTAALVFDVPLKEVTPKMRHAAKAVNFGILYGQSAFGLSKELSISATEAKSFIETYFSKYKKVADYLQLCKDSVRKKGYSITLFGRKRPIPEITSKNVFLRQAAERLAVNTPLQGTAADLIKIAMINIHKKIEKTKGYMILQIHDELIFELPDEEIPLFKRIVKTEMEGVMKLKIPLLVDISVGKNWGEC